MVFFFTAKQLLESPTANGKRESVIALKAQKGLGEGEREKSAKGKREGTPYPLSTIPLPFSLSLTPCLLMFTATYFYKEITIVN